MICCCAMLLGDRRTDFPPLKTHRGCLISVLCVAFVSCSASHSQPSAHSRPSSSNTPQSLQQHTLALVLAKSSVASRIVSCFHPMLRLRGGKEKGKVVVSKRKRELQKARKHEGSTKGEMAVCSSCPPPNRQTGARAHARATRK